MKDTFDIKIEGNSRVLNSEFFQSEDRLHHIVHSFFINMFSFISIDK